MDRHASLRSEEKCQRANRAHRGSPVATALPLLALTKISFSITDTSGTWASAGNVLIANALGQAVADHVYATSSPANSTNGATVTGYAAVPEPAILMELGVLLLGLGLLVSLGVLRPRIAL